MTNTPEAQRIKDLATELGQALFVCRSYVEAVESGTFLLDEGDDYALEVARGLLARQKEREEKVLARGAAIRARRAGAVSEEA